MGPVVSRTILIHHHIRVKSREYGLGYDSVFQTTMTFAAEELFELGTRIR